MLSHQSQIDGVITRLIMEHEKEVEGSGMK